MVIKTKLFSFSINQGLYKLNLVYLKKVMWLYFKTEIAITKKIYNEKERKPVRRFTMSLRTYKPSPERK
jgi:hypothetical protein